MNTALVKVTHKELALGMPIPFPIYSESGKLLLNAGYVLRSDTQLERLFVVGAFRAGEASTGASEQSSANDSIHAGLGADKPAPSQDLPVSAPFPTIAAGPEAFQITLRGENKTTLRAEYVGVVKGRGILVTVPENDESLQLGAEVDVKLLHGRSIYQFRSRVASRSGAPFDILYLDYPQSVTQHTVRQHLRIEVNFPARLLRNDAVMAGFDATVVNLSLNGIGVSLKDATLDKGEHFKLSVRLGISNKSYPLMLNCIVRNTRQMDGHMMIGAELGALPDDIRRLLKDYVFEAATGTNLS